MASYASIELSPGNALPRLRLLIDVTGNASYADADGKTHDESPLEKGAFHWASSIWQMCAPSVGGMR
jgi:hypothetical protein